MPAPRRAITATTRVAGVVGAPVRHSLSPAILNAAFDAAGLDWAYVAFEVPEGRGPDVVAAMRALDLAGLSVTMPHKAAVVPAVDRCSPLAEALGAVNCLAWDGDEVVGHNTDGGGFLASLAADAGWSASGRRCAVLGAGGAARAVIAALGAAGADDVVVVNRTAERGRAAAALAGPVGRLGDAADVAAAELVVNATSVGMSGNPGVPVDPDVLHAGQVVVDLVYQPVDTALLVAAARAGAVAVDGVGMLVHQAALAFELWTAAPAPVEAMGAAAREALAER